MPYFKVMHNGKLLANAGLSTIAVLNAYVTVGPQGPAFLGVGGMRVTKKRHEHFEWVSQSLRPGDEVSIAYVASGKSTRPISKRVHQVRDAQSIEEELRRLQAQIAEFEARAPVEPPIQPPNCTRAPRPRMLKVSTSRRQPIDAELGDEEQLQAVLNLTAGSCVLEVDATTVLDDGSTKGKRWLQQELRPGQQVRITYAT
jgi:hypothetical protein